MFNRVYQSGESLAQTNPVLYTLLGTLINRRDFQYAQDMSESNVDPAFNVQWDVSDNAMAYASWVKASKAGRATFRLRFTKAAARRLRTQRQVTLTITGAGATSTITLRR